MTNQRIGVVLLKKTFWEHTAELYDRLIRKGHIFLPLKAHRQAITKHITSFLVRYPATCGGGIVAWGRYKISSGILCHCNIEKSQLGISNQHGTIRKKKEKHE